VRETVPVDKKPGDALSAKHINRLGIVSNRMSRLMCSNVSASHHTGSHIGVVAHAPWKQQIVIVTDLQISEDDPVYNRLYLVRPRYYKSEVGYWDLDVSAEWILDARDMELDLAVGDKVVAYWDRQRGAFVPCWHWEPTSLVDCNSEGYELIPVTNYFNSDIHFALELSQDGVTNWGAVNDRVCKINANVVLEKTHGIAYASGSIFYTFRVAGEGECYLRVAMETGLHEIDGTPVSVHLENSCVRLEAKAENGIASTHGFTVRDRFIGVGPAGNVATGWSLEASIQNEAVLKVPVFASDGTRIKITCPPDPGGTLERWTVKVDLAMVFSIMEEEETSSSCTSSISTSSLSGSSYTSSSSISTSSISTSSSSSSLSSSSGTLCDMLIHPDDCWLGCDGGYIKHKHPHDKDTFADCNNTHWTGLVGFCGFQFDDAGHVMGYHTSGVGGQWESPWGFPDPN